MATPFTYLFTPFRIGPVVVRNRIFSPPYETSLVEDEARGWWDRLAHFHAERARGGIGLIIMSDVCAHPSGAVYTMTPLDERHVPHVRKVPDMVHAHGAKIFQLIHQHGRQSRAQWTHHAAWAPSPLRGPGAVEIPHEMDRDEIGEMVAAYARTARVIREAGFDGVEIQGSHSFLVGSFLSPATNQRSDEYGGSTPSRMRFLREVLDAVRGEIGTGMALGVSLSVDELNPNGLQVPEAKDIAGRLEEDGVVDYLAARIGDFAAIPVWLGDMSIPPGAATYLAAELKRTVRLPILTMLRIKDPIHAERILADGEADMVGMGRATLCDPELPRKAHEGRLEEIRHCISCNQGCVARIQIGLNIECALNPAAAYERQYGAGRISRASRRKRVVVVGGGPAGLKAAETAALRGHRVTLLERGEQLGGQVLAASKLPGREEIAEATGHLVGQLGRLGVEVLLKTEGTVERLRQHEPDAVVVATGSVETPPSFPTEGGVPLFSPLQVIEGAATTGGSVVVVDGGDSHWKFCGTAELLGRQGRTVILVTPRFFVGWDLPGTAVPLLYQRLAKLGAEVVTCSVVVRVDADGVILQNLYSRQQQHVAADSIVWVGENRASDGLTVALQGLVPELHRAGDCVAPRKIEAAIREGFLAGLRV